LTLKYIKKPIIKSPIVILSAIITIGITIRIIFVPFEIPLNSDNFAYFMYAIDHSLGQNSTMQVSNDGWPLFVSFFFSLYNSSNFLDYMAMQRILSVVISSLIAIPIYFLCRRFFDERLALLGSLIFVFEPRIIQNSTFGITDPLYILLIVIGMVLILSSSHKRNYLAFIAIALASTVRIEGLFLLPALVFMCFLKNPINKEKIWKIMDAVLSVAWKTEAYRRKPVLMDTLSVEQKKLYNVVNSLYEAQIKAYPAEYKKFTTLFEKNFKYYI